MKAVAQQRHGVHSRPKHYLAAGCWFFSIPHRPAAPLKTLSRIPHFRHSKSIFKGNSCKIVIGIHTHASMRWCFDPPLQASLITTFHRPLPGVLPSSSRGPLAPLRENSPRTERKCHAHHDCELPLHGYMAKGHPDPRCPVKPLDLLLRVRIVGRCRQSLHRLQARLNFTRKILLVEIEISRSRVLLVVRSTKF